MDNPADIVVPRCVPPLSQQLWAAGEEMVDSFNAFLAEPALIIVSHLEDFLEPVREESFVLCCKNNPLIVKLQYPSFQPFK